MRIKARLRTLATRALYETMDVRSMIHLARRLFGSYDLYERTGFPLSVPIPNRDAARQIVDDVIEAGLLLDFASLLVELERLGAEGRSRRSSPLQAIVREILEEGYYFDEQSRSFVEDTDIRTTRNWGVLRDGESYIFTFLGIDVVGNSDLVREHGPDAMGPLYRWLRRLITNLSEKRNGRLWVWEGDGGIVAFASEEQNLRATLTGIELLNELLIYNLTECPLDDGLHVRIIVHQGPCEYGESGAELTSDTIKRIRQIDVLHGAPDTMIVTDSVYPSLERVVASALRPIHIADDQKYHTYSVGFTD
jgi:class 3 adenylate cyclase